MAKLIKERVDDLEKEVAELKVIVHQLCEANITIDDVKRHLNIEATPSIVEDKPKTANELRGEIIEKAKEFVEDGAKEDLSLNRGRGYVVHFITNKAGGYICDLEFVVNEDKRTVVAILRWNTLGQSEIKAKGIAKCNPSDVFNEHIGKAIALGRALNVDVSEFEQAVQPTEVAVGQIVKSHKTGNELEVSCIRPNSITEQAIYFTTGSWLKVGEMTIINDTNVIYGGVE